MDPERHRFWQAYVDELRQLMELRDWDVRLDPQPTEPLANRPNTDGGLASVECLYGRKVAKLQLAEDWEEYPPDEQRNAMVHELIHCHLTGAADTVLDGMLTLQLGEAAYAILRNTFLRHLEYGVDAIAHAWADQLPMPTADDGMTEREVEQLFDLDPGDVTRAETVEDGSGLGYTVEAEHGPELAVPGDGGADGEQVVDYKGICECQDESPSDPIYHAHYPEPPHRCARGCGCKEYRPAKDQNRTFRV